MAENKEKEKKDSDVPKHLNDSSIDTTMKTLSQNIKLKLEQLKDLATLEVALPIHTRLQKRLESLREMTNADSYKIDGEWKTKPPQMHVTKLEGHKINNEEAVIKFSVYEMDEKGNKVPTIKTSSFTNSRGESFERETSAEYQIAYHVKEIIRHRKPITREIIKVDKPEE